MKSSRYEFTRYRYHFMPFRCCVHAMTLRFQVLLTVLIAVGYMFDLSSMYSIVTSDSDTAILDINSFLLLSTV